MSPQNTADNLMGMPISQEKSEGDVSQFVQNTKLFLAFSTINQRLQGRVSEYGS
jgi:hypothetical protein